MTERQVDEHDEYPPDVNPAEDELRISHAETADRLNLERRLDVPTYESGGEW